MQEQNAKIKDGLILGVIFVAILLVTIYLPAVELITMFVLPIPIIIYTTRHGWKAAAVLGIITILTTLLFTIYVLIASLPLTLIAVLAGMLIGQAIRSHRHPYEVWLQGTIGFTVGFLILFVLIERLAGISFATEYQLLISESLDSSRAMLESMGVPVSTEDLNLIEHQMLILLDIIPSILTIMAAVMAFVTQWLSYKFLSRWQDRQYRFPAFRLFMLPKQMIWLYFIVMILSWIDLSSQPTIAAIILNLSIIMSIIFALQGLSFVFYYMHKKRQPIFVAILITIFSLIFLPIGLYLLPILGIIDIGFQMRKRLK